MCLLFLFHHTWCGHGFNDQLDINWGRLLLLVCEFCCGRIRAVYTRVMFDPQPAVCTLCCYKGGFLLQALCSVCPLTSVWMCSGRARPCWHCVRFTPRDSEQVSDRDKLSGSIHQTPIVSVLVHPGPVRPERTCSSLSKGDKPVKTRTLIRQDRHSLTGVSVCSQTQLPVCSRL